MTKGGSSSPVSTASVSNGDFMTARFTPGGTFDSLFGQNGKVIYGFASTSEDFAWDLAVDDGRVLVVGVTPQGGGAFALVRFRENGWPDPSFGGNGSKITNFTPAFDGALAVELQPDGRIVATGGSNGAQGQIAVAPATTADEAAGLRPACRLPVGCIIRHA